MSEDKKIVLIVEDDEFLRSLTAKRLEKESLGVMIAVDGENAMNVLSENRPDIILLDLLLPGLNGFEVLEKVRQDDNLKDVPIIVFSNLGQKEDLEKAKSLGANDYLIKANFTLDDVIAKIKNYIK